MRELRGRGGRAAAAAAAAIAAAVAAATAAENTVQFSFLAKQPLTKPIGLAHFVRCELNWFVSNRWVRVLQSTST